MKGLKKFWKVIFKFNFFLFITNAIKFRKELAIHQWWDYSHSLIMMRRSLIIIRDGLVKKGSEVFETRQKKIEKITRVIHILDNICESNYIDMAESELGRISETPLGKETEEEKIHNRAVFLRADEIENAEWDELCTILKGQDMSEFLGKQKPIEEWFDGSGMRTWWD